MRSPTLASLALAYGQPNNDAPKARLGRLSGCFAAAPPKWALTRDKQYKPQQPVVWQGSGLRPQNPVTATLHAAARHKNYSSKNHDDGNDMLNYRRL